MSILSFPAKQRDDFGLVGSCKLPGGAWTVTCEAQRADGSGTRWTLEVVLGSVANGVASLSIDAAHTVTADWPPGPLIADLKFVDAETGRVAHTGKFQIDVESVVTR